MLVVNGVNVSFGSTLLLCRRCVLGFACVVLLIGGGIARAEEASGREAFVSWARSNAVPLRSIESGPRQEEWKRLKPIIGSARVVALGEPAHGVHQSLALRNRLFEFLVEEAGFTALATESSFSEAGVVSDFIAGSVAAMPQLGFVPSAEDEEILLWMRAYNADPAHVRKLRFYGIDLGLGGLGNSYPSPPPLRAALGFLTKTIPDDVAPLRTKLEPHLARLPGPGNGPPVYSSVEQNELTGAIEDLIGLLERNRPRLIAVSSKQAYELAHRSAVVARQADKVFRVSPPDARPGQIPPGAWRSATARDAGMADNVLWALGQEGPTGRVLVFAHNAHVKNAPTQGGLWDAFERPPGAMGQYLRQSLGADLLVVGSCAAYPVDGPPRSTKGAESLDDALTRAGSNPFIIDLRSAGMPALAASWLTTPKALTANNDSFLILPPRPAFDLLFVGDRLTPIVPPKAR